MDLATIELVSVASLSDWIVIRLLDSQTVNSRQPAPLSSRTKDPFIVAILTMTSNSPSVLDLRSLALFRILLGAYVLYDVYSRLSLGRYDLAWYTAEAAFLAPHDNPHKAPLHKLWFHRGSQMTQLTLFGITAILGACFMLGFRLNAASKTLLWVLITAQTSRNMHVHDGSDTFLRHLLFWSIFLPLDRYWTIQRKPRAASSSVQGVACLALTLQIALMYLGTVAHRTTDRFSWSDMHHSEWLPPQLTAVYYAMAGDFASRNNALVRLIRSTPALSQSMTAAAMLMESLPPLMCLVDGKRRHWYALILFQLHLGLYLTINLPNWQFLGMLVQSVWIPTRTWDQWMGDRTAARKKSDDGRHTKPVPPTHLRPNPVSAVIQLFFLAYMIYNWLGCRGWIRKHDNGDIGEGLRLSQYWVMYGSLSHNADTLKLTALVDGPEYEEDVRVDLLHYIKTGEFVPPEPSDVVPEDMSDRYPSPRWERALSQWASASDTTRGRRMLSRLCGLVNEDRQKMHLSRVKEIEMRYQHLRIRPPGSETRYLQQRRADDSVMTVECKRN